MGTARTKGAVWAWLVVIGCIGFYSIPTGIIGNTSGIFVAPVMDQFGWTQTDTTMYRTIQPLVAAVCAPIAGKLMEKYNPRWILAAVSAAFGLASWASAYATELWQWNLYGVVYGVTSAFYMYLAAPVLINAWFKKSAGLAISITAATLSILAAVASPIGQELINQFGWQTARAALSIVTTVLSVVLTVVSLGTRVVLAYALSAIPAIGVTGIWWSVPIGWFLADAVGGVYYWMKKKALFEMK